MKYSEYLKQNISVNLRWTCLDNNSDFLSNIRIGKFLTASIIFSEYENGSHHILGLSISYPVALTPTFASHFTQRTFT